MKEEERTARLDTKVLSVKSQYCAIPLGVYSDAIRRTVDTIHKYIYSSTENEWEHTHLHVFPVLHRQSVHLIDNQHFY